MQPKTETANNQNWVEASKAMKISAYVESYMPTSVICKTPFSGQNLYEEVRKVSLPVFNRDFQLCQELLGWDALSDEALRIFEEKLD